MEYKSKKNIYAKILTNLTISLISLNTFLFIIISLTINFYFSLNTHYQIAQLRKLDKNTIVPIDYFFKSNLTRLEENDIAYRVVKIPYDVTNNNLHFFGSKGKNNTKFIAQFDEKDKIKLLIYLDNHYNKIFNYYQSYKKAK